MQKAVSCLRDQLNPDELNALLCKLGAAAQGHDIKVGGNEVLVPMRYEED